MTLQRMEMILTPDVNCGIIPVYPKKEVDPFPYLFYNGGVKPHMEMTGKTARSSLKINFFRKI